MADQTPKVAKGALFGRAPPNVVRNNGFGSINGLRPPRTLQLVTRLTF